MATATRISDVVVPAIFNPYVQNRTMELSALVQSGILVPNAELSQNLAGGGLTFSAPTWKDLGNEEENTGNDDPDDEADAQKRGTYTEVAVRVNRNQAWAAMALTSALAGSNPMEGIGDLVAAYWARRMQAVTIAITNGIFADNDAAPTAGEHGQGDMTVKPAYEADGTTLKAFSAGVTNVTAEAVIDALTTLGDAASQVTAIAMHSIPYSRLQKNNLIDFIPDSRGEVMIPTFLGKRVIVDDGMPNPAGVGSASTAGEGTGVYHTWLMTGGIFAMGTAAPTMPTDIEWDSKAGNGQGMETLRSRVQYAIHPRGHSYIGPQANGGPTNAQFAAATSWKRVAPERKQVALARLVTREF